MKVTLTWEDEDKGYLVDWNELIPRWKLSTYYLDPNILESAYANLWFNTAVTPPLFYIGELTESECDCGFQLINGRNRTTVLSTVLDGIVPLALSDDAETIPFIASAIVRPLSPNEVFELPDLPILAHSELRQLGGEDYEGGGQ
ncbi:hypothetical protein [Cerasicoccus maritimus]|uniref:hypothetical protein n=1 Tax=Cerasicoccus maritimus TaxID=490089 RepID=UPI002852C3E0|nr:hypothetical protein [Cerasicoccus maritimus]